MYRKTNEICPNCRQPIYRYEGAWMGTIPPSPECACEDSNELPEYCEVPPYKKKKMLQMLNGRWDIITPSMKQSAGMPHEMVYRAVDGQIKTYDRYTTPSREEGGDG